MKGQYRMDPSKRVRGWIVCGSKGPYPSTFRMTIEEVEKQADRLVVMGLTGIRVHEAYVEVLSPVTK